MNYANQVIKYKIGFISLLLKYERTCVKRRVCGPASVVIIMAVCLCSLNF